jgi:hypothetical protein
LNCRQTNVDQIALRLSREADPNDYIIVHPWHCGVSFARYYAGPAPWTTLPPIEDHEIHRYDQLKVQMQLAHPIQPVLEAAESALRDGHRVWVVGRLEESPGVPPEPKRAPNNPWGWHDAPYTESWGAQMRYFLAGHTVQRMGLPRLSLGSVNPLEDLPVVVLTGWSD